MNKIFFVTVDLHEQVHMQALGFTKQFYLYAWASNAAEAEQVSRIWAEQQGCKVRRVTTNANGAVKQDIKTYTFVESIINLPDEILLAEYDRREYPPKYRVPGRKVSIPAATQA